MYIDVRIPFDSDKENLGFSYNASMESVEDWVLFLDHDVFLVNPHWHHICSTAIKALASNNAGWISCRTNRLGCIHQIAPDAPQGDDLAQHLVYAQDREKTYKGLYTEVTHKEPFLSGFFILTRKSAWEKTKGFSSGFLGVDNNYHIRLINEGYRLFILEELYCYHRYQRFWQRDMIC